MDDKLRHPPFTKCIWTNKKDKKQYNATVISHLYAGGLILIEHDDDKQFIVSIEDLKERIE